MKSIPWGIPNIFTYAGSEKIYFIGTAIKINKIYELPSTKAVHLNNLNIKL